MASPTYTSTAYPPSATSLRQEKRPYQYEVVPEPEDDRLNRASATDQRMKRKIRFLRVIQRALNLCVSIAVLGIMLNTYLTFAHNRTIKDPNSGQTIPIYPVNPITWPTYMMIATGAVSILFNSAIMTAYVWRNKSGGGGGAGANIALSNRISSWSDYWGYLMHVVNIGIWLATSTTFQKSQGAPDSVPPPNDLYGWTCSDRVDELTAQFAQLPVNFDLQCKTQQISFAMGIVNAGLEVLAIAINIYAIRRMIHKQRYRRFKNGQDGLSTVS